MIWHIYKKELIDCLRDRKTIIFSVLIPILLNVGIIFFADKMMARDQTDSMSVAVTKNSDASVIDWLKNDDNIKVIESKNPLSAVEQGKALAALKIPGDFSSEMRNMKSPEVTVYIDSSSMNSGATADYIQNILNKHREAIVNERLDQLNVNSQTIAPFNVVEKGVSKEDDGSLTMIAMFAPMIIIMGVLGGILPSANDIFAGEKERKTMEALLMSPVKRTQLLVGKWLTISTFGIISGLLSTLAFVLSVRYLTKVLNNALQLKGHFTTFIFSFLVSLTLLALLGAMVLCILSLLASSVKEAQSYTSQIMMVAILPYFLLMGKSVHELQPSGFLIPIYNVFALMKQLLYGVYDMQSLAYTIGSLSVCTVVLFTIGYTMFTKSRWVLGKG
ncbi:MULTISPECIES: ABC transporter permease [Priestia]|jgi:sodium transport system permease protein|uniref:ABC transporter permease n=1 Tax=Priestia TaxID=2800373 RepID=UPI002447EC04|nr:MULTISPECIES: ABC transporter permease [Priestia]MDH2453765.1 ABC transporter permease [Priestia megaterium]MDL5153222.1 ABC transporter permease [Priestia megaterium]MDP9724659.1 sodium transport system permease protein [Priestia aryabhattai]